MKTEEKMAHCHKHGRTYPWWYDCHECLEDEILNTPEPEFNRCMPEAEGLCYNWLECPECSAFQLKLERQGEEDNS